MTLLLLCLFACDSKTPIQVDSGGGDQDSEGGGGSDLVDEDGDGYLESVDCDDDDATIHPGAEETWYDDVDQDCDGHDDDQDEDGYLSADDCDDEDPTINPAAGEVPDDGIDQNCDGADATSAVVDSDSDGFGEQVDCDDLDAAIHPGAVDTAGDGVDQDCDGEDATTTSSDDVDVDGYTTAVDCDDLDASIHPGADDPSGDGVDQDCDGADDAPAADGDGDGWASEAFGGNDCDDEDANVNPGAAETRGDDVDSDCDGGDFAIDQLAVGDLVLTEIMYDPFAVDDGDGEWFELYNATGHAVSLAGLVVSDDSAYAAADLFTVEEALVAAAGARLVFVVNADSSLNGGITGDYDYAGGGVSLNNGGDDLYVGVPTGSGYTTIDSVSYDEAAGWTEAKGESLELADTAVSTSSNDRASNWCLATGTAGSTSDKGSPGAASTGC